MFNYTKDTWKRKGLLIGFCLFFLNSVVVFGSKELAFTGNNLLIYLILWIIGGQILGYVFYKWQLRTLNDD